MILGCLAMGIWLGIWGYILGIVLWSLLAWVQTPLYRWLIARRTRRLLAASPTHSEVGPRTIEVDDTGLSATSPTSTSHVTWPAVQHVAHTDSHIFIYLGVTQAFVIPRTAMTEHDFHALMAVLRSHAPEAARAGAA
jgi:hypothetical protein